MNKKENLDEWIEAKTGVKFLCWDKLKPSIENPDDAVVVKKGETIQGIVSKIDEQLLDGEVIAYKWFLQTKEHPEPVLVWSNASLFRQIQEIGISEGDEVQLTYVKEYEAKGGNKGREIKLKVRKS